MDIKIVSIPCEDCGGSGNDRGGLRANEPEKCLTCNGSGREEITLGDRIQYRNDDTRGIHLATVTDFSENGWLEIEDVLIPDDNPTIHPDAVMGRLHFAGVPLSLEERLVASIAIAAHRKQVA